MSRAVFTTQDKIAILEQAKVLLGKGGRNWIKKSFYGRRLSSPSPRYAYEYTTGKNADCYCLAGAIERAAYDLGFIARPAPASDTTCAVSIDNLIVEKYGKSTTAFNDSPRRTWNEIRDIINLRIRQLEKEASDQGTGDPKE